MRVESGDNLWKITSDYFKNELSDDEVGKKVQELAVFNNISNPELIYPNQEIDLSCFDTVNKDDEKEITTPILSKDTEVEKSDYVDNSDDKNYDYQVKSGDSLWKIASNYFEGKLSNEEISKKVHELQEFNEIQDSAMIYVNQHIDLSCFGDDLKKADSEIKTDDIEKSDSILEAQDTVEPSNSQDKESQTSTYMWDEIESLHREISQDKDTKTETIQFRRGTPDDYEFASDEIKEKAMALWKKSQNCALSDEILRPVPSFDKNGNIVANQQYFESKTEGKLTGTTVLINAGHGGYDPNGTAFDPGAVNEASSTEEWMVNHKYAEQLTQALLEQGANVLMVQGEYETLSDAVDGFKQTYGVDETNLRMISLHCNSNNSSSPSGIAYYNSDGNNELINYLCDSAKESGLEVNGICQHNTRVCQAANRNGIPNALVEIGFLSNPDDLERITKDTKFQKNFIDSLVSGLINSVA